MRRTQQLRLLKIVANKLQPHRHAVGAKTGGHAHAGQAGEARRQRVNVSQVVGYRVIRFFPQLPRNRGRHRAGDDVAYEPHRVARGQRRGA